MLAESSFGFGEDLVGAVTEAISLEMMGVMEREGEGLDPMGLEWRITLFSFIRTRLVTGPRVDNGSYDHPAPHPSTEYRNASKHPWRRTVGGYGSADPPVPFHINSYCRIRSMG